MCFLCVSERFHRFPNTKRDRREERKLALDNPIGAKVKNSTYDYNFSTEQHVFTQTYKGSMLCSSTSSPSLSADSFLYRAVWKEPQPAALFFHFLSYIISEYLSFFLSSLPSPPLQSHQSPLSWPPPPLSVSFCCSLCLFLISACSELFTQGSGD